MTLAVAVRVENAPVALAHFAFDEVLRHRELDREPRAEREKLVAVVTQLLPYIGYPRALSALTCVNEVASGVQR